MNKKITNQTFWSKRYWSKEEAQLLTWTIESYCKKMDNLNYQMLDKNNWLEIARFIPGRNYQQCKFKFYQYRKVNTNKTMWTQNEDNELQMQVKEHGIRNWN